MAVYKEGRPNIMDFNNIKSPTGFLELMLGELPEAAALEKYEA
jgi:hypothetical protein